MCIPRFQIFLRLVLLFLYHVLFVDIYFLSFGAQHWFYMHKYLGTRMKAFFVKKLNVFKPIH